MVTPTQLFLDWLHGLDPENRHLTLADVQRDPSIYLLTECNFEHQLLKFLEDSCEEIFERELESWDRLEESWPSDLSFEAFQQWFDYSVHWMLIDLADERVVREEL